jgi:hypothetical protein
LGREPCGGLVGYRCSSLASREARSSHCVDESTLLFCSFRVHVTRYGPDSFRTFRHHGVFRAAYRFRLYGSLFLLPFTFVRCPWSASHRDSGETTDFLILDPRVWRERARVWQNPFPRSLAPTNRASSWAVATVALCLTCRAPRFQLATVSHGGGGATSQTREGEKASAGTQAGLVADA